MAFRRININAPLYENIDPKEISDFSAEMHDVYRDDLGITVRRPGLKTFADIGGGPINGIFEWEDKNLAYVVSGKDFYSVTEGGVGTLLASGLFEQNTRVVWAESLFPTQKLFAVNGGRIVEYDGTTAQKITDADAPLNVSHIAVFDTYLLANEIGTSRFHHSDVGVPDSWSSNFFSTEASPDKLKALLVGWNEIQLPGSKTIENWYNDGSTPFVPFKGSLIQFGTLSPYSTILLDNSLFFLNMEKRLMRINQRQPVVLSVPVDRIISNLSNFSDVLADNIIVGGRTFLLLTFPEADKTLVYDYARDQWMGYWSTWNKTTARYNRFRGNSFTYMTQWNKHLVGDFANGKVYEFDFDTYQDDGQTIRSAWLTGHIDHGTNLEKESNELKIRVKRGKGASGSAEPLLMVRWRDNGSDVWSNTRNIGLGLVGDTEMYVQTDLLGTYRSRQYEFSITDNVPFSLINVEEDVDLVLE